MSEYERMTEQRTGREYGLERLLDKSLRHYPIHRYSRARIPNFGMQGRSN